MSIPNYILERFQRPIPPDCCVPNCLPTIANGDPGIAKVATVGLNPGWDGPARKDSTQPDMGEIEQAWEGQKMYFQDEVYGRYFTPLERALKECGASYYDGSACNIDLVSWPTETKPKGWSNVPNEAQRKLLDADHEFFTTLLAENPNIELLLGNGRAVGERMVEKFGVTRVPAHDINKRLDCYCGEVAGRLFIGWSTFLNNSPLNTEQRARMAQRVAEWYRNGGCP